MTHVPYRSGSATMTDLLGGQIDVAFDTITVVDPQFRAGKVTVLGVTSGTRWWRHAGRTSGRRSCAGLRCAHMGRHRGAPGLAEVIRKKLNDAMRAALTDPAIADRLRKTGGMDVRGSSPDECGPWSPARSRAGRKW